MSTSSRPRRALVAAVVAAGAAAVLSPVAEAAVPGLAGYTWTTDAVAPGVTVRTGVLTQQNHSPFWTVTITAPAKNVLTGAATTAELGDAQWARDTAARLTAAGYPVRQDTVRWPGFSDTPRGVEGFRVRTGSYATQAEATAAAAKLKAAGFSALAEWTGYDADQAADAERVHVAVIDRKGFHGTIQATHDGTVAQREPTSSIAAKAGALVAVNGGFFVTADADGFQGVPAGLAAYDGKIQSLSSGARAALVLGRHGDVGIENLTSAVTLRSGAASHAVNGVNRKPGVVRDCGRPGLTPTTQPRQDFTCTTTDELVLFTPEFGAALPIGAGTQVTLDRTGRVLSVGARLGAVPAGGSVVQGIGASADWLTAHAVAGRRLTVDGRLRTASGRPVDLRAGDGIVSAAPVLLRDGRQAIDAATEGVLDPRDLSFGYAWAEQRQPRTMAGLDAQGRLLLVTVDGRQPGVSEGVTVEEGAQLMRSLGAVDALNLDGGGSTAMAVNGALVNHPSDAAGERPIGDAVLVR
ncbi:phosphodiester glycosidase family protein [Amycolatopsis sp. FDAARGOS 1241]|uniref:phosphodiester glycosidase family protein n=1 Tax=Amycolatopsis sp. FDAARGOS 1241 TaxID=2778070 RepID=UPI001EF2EE45|nr:phosphodiester glycosidase family protein [Amycolatopsis sp. FDAARGOS 1241]